MPLQHEPLQDEHPKHPPDQEERDDGSGDVDDPVARGLRFPKIEHSAIVAVPRVPLPRDRKAAEKHRSQKNNLNER